MCTNSPFLNKAILGDDGGKGNISVLAASTASLSTPAKTVIKLAGFLPPSKLIFAPGRAFLAAQPQTELITTNVVPSALIAFFTSSAVYKFLKPASVNSARIGFTIFSGYIMYIVIS